MCKAVCPWWQVLDHVDRSCMPIMPWNNLSSCSASYQVNHTWGQMRVGVQRPLEINNQTETKATVSEICHWPVCSLTSFSSVLASDPVHEHPVWTCPGVSAVSGMLLWGQPVSGLHLGKVMFYACLNLTFPWDIPLLVNHWGKIFFVIYKHTLV